MALTNSSPHAYRGRPWDDPLFSPAGLIEQLHKAVSTYTTHAAVTEVTGRGDPLRTVTYGQLWDAIEAMARRVPVERAGPGRMVGVLVDNTIESLTTVLGIVRAGGAAVVIDASEPEERREQMIASVGCMLISSDGETLTAPSRENAVQDQPERTWPAAIVVFTTGSTAASKAVVQSGYSVAVNARAVAQHHRLRPGVKLACPLPISHVNGLELGLFATLLSGGHTILMREFDPLSFGRALSSAEAHLVTAVPSVLKMAITARQTPQLPHLRYFISAAAPLHSSVAREVMDKFGKRVVQGYGLSECMNFATTMPVRLSTADYEALVLNASIPPVGHELPGCEVAVLDSAGKEVIGREGEVCVRGHSVMSEYLGAAAETAEALRGGWLHTSDLGRLDSGPLGTSLLTVTGRIKHIAKCGGLGVSFEEIERAVLRLAMVREACCVARPHPILGEALSLFVVLGSEPLAACLNDIRDQVRTVVDPRRVGLRILGLDNLPQLRSGKVNRPLLADRALPGRS